jgi:hypothetical protein
VRFVVKNAPSPSQRQRKSAPGVQLSYSPHPEKPTKGINSYKALHSRVPQRVETDPGSCVRQPPEPRLNLCSPDYMRMCLFISALVFISLQMRAQDSSWHYRKDDPITKKRSAQIDATSFQQIRDGHAKLLHEMSARLYDATGSSYKQISSKQAIVDERLGTLTYGPSLTTVVKLAAPRN